MKSMVEAALVVIVFVAIALLAVPWVMALVFRYFAWVERKLGGKP